MGIWNKIKEFFEDFFFCDHSWEVKVCGDYWVYKCKKCGRIDREVM